MSSRRTSSASCSCACHHSPTASASGRSAAAQRHPRLPPPLPWLALRDGSLVDLNGAPVRCAPIIREGVFNYLAVDDMAFLVHDDGGCSLMNPLFGSTLPLPELATAVRRAIDKSTVYNESYIRKAHVKVIMSSQLDSTPDPLVAVLILEGYSIAIAACKKHDAVNISMFPDPKRRTGTKRRWDPEMIDDIAFLHGKLYVLTPYEGLHVIELDSDHSVS
ncbi:hypothetical protein ACP70R_001494 [Stipagrostis hirtigluma subsp. patula]